MKINNFIKTSLCLFVVLFQCSTEAMVQILPPSYSLGDQLGQSIGQGFQQGFNQAAQEQYILEQNLIQSYYDQQLLNLLSQQQKNNDLQELKQKLDYWEQQTKNDWAKEFELEIYRTDAIRNLEQIETVTSLSSFSGKDPSIQMLAATILFCGKNEPNYQELFYKCCPHDRLENPKEFAFELLLDAVKKNYIPAKKTLVVFYNEQGDIENTMNWLYSLAVDGSAEAMRQLALKYGSGEGFYKNEVEMIKWVLLASFRGDLPASYLENFITKWYSSTPSYIEGKKRALDWKRFPQHR